METISLTYNGWFTSMTIYNNDIPIEGKTSSSGIQQYTIVIYTRISSEVTITTKVTHSEWTMYIGVSIVFFDYILYLYIFLFYYFVIMFSKKERDIIKFPKHNSWKLLLNLEFDELLVRKRRYGLTLLWLKITLYLTFKNTT